MQMAGGGVMHYGHCQPSAAYMAGPGGMGPMGEHGYRVADPGSGAPYFMQSGGRVHSTAAYYGPSHGHGGGGSGDGGSMAGRMPPADMAPVGCAPDAYKLFVGNVPTACAEQVKSLLISRGAAGGDARI
jgi:hypothetical protein